MTRSFAEFAAEQKATWDDDTKKVYDAAASAFESEVAERTRLGTMFREAREGARMSQTQLADLADTQQAEISRVESGLSNPTETTLIRLSNALGLRLTLEAAVRP